MIVSTDTQSEIRGDTWTIELSLADLADYVTIDFTVKEQLSDADAAAILQVRLNASGLDDGLLILNKAVYGTPADGDIVIFDVPWGVLIITVQADATAELEPRTYDCDVQVIYGTGEVQTYHDSVFRVVGDVTRVT